GASRGRAASDPIPRQRVARPMLRTKPKLITGAVPVIGALLFASCAFQAKSSNVSRESVAATQTQDKRVNVVKTPGGGIQPQAVVDARGVLHLVYFKGEAEAGDLFYVRREQGKTEFSAPIRANSQAGSAIATGTIRGGQLAIGKNGRVHVAWNGSGKA